MEIRKYRSLNMGTERDDCEIICTHEELDALKYALEMVGVNVMVSVHDGAGKEDHIYFRNEYRTGVHWSNDAKLNAKIAEEFFERNKRGF